MDLNIPVSGRELARLTGQSEGAVRKAVARSSIIEGKTADGKFIPKIAAREWGKDILPQFGGPKITVLVPSILKLEKKPQRIPKEKREPVTAEEIVREVMGEKLPRVSKNDLDDEDFDSEEEEIDDKIQKPEAERRTAILKAKILQIALKEKQGEMLPRLKVEKVLFGYGQEIRISLTGLPAKIIDRIRACDERHEALRVMDESIYEALNLLTDIEERQF